MMDMRASIAAVVNDYDLTPHSPIEVAQRLLAALRANPDAVLAALWGADTDWTIDNPVWSYWTIGGERQTWKQVYEREREQRMKADCWGVLVSDLDRCEHGRHEGDVCSGCNGQSRGGTQAGTTLGHTIDARPIVMPERSRRHDIEAWFSVRQQEGENGG